MSEHHDPLETRAAQAREADLFARLPAVLEVALAAPGYGAHLGSVDPAAVTSSRGARPLADPAQGRFAGASEGLPALRRLRLGAR
jgi:hypothetical protein